MKNLYPNDLTKALRPCRTHWHVRRWGLCLVIVLGLLWGAMPGRADPKPNFIIILADDQGYQDLGCFGSLDLKTPRIDELSEQGLKLTSFYAQPVCGPSRASLLLGAYPMRVAETGNEKRPHPHVHDKEIFISEVLRDAGYRTGMVGKWHLAGMGKDFDPESMPPSAGFDYFFGVPGSNDRGLRTVYRNTEIVETNLNLNTVVRRYTEEAIGFVRRNKDRPFFLYLAHTMPHVRLGVDPAFLDKSGKNLYGDVIQEMDCRTGELIDVLRELKLDRKTYVIYLSDNGPWLTKGDHAGCALPLSGGKVTVQEGGVRVPCIVWAPGRVPGGRVYNDLAKTMDLFPTLVELAGAKMPTDRAYDGESLVGILQGTGKLDAQNRTYYYYLQSTFLGVRRGKWKLLLPRPPKPPWLGPWVKKSWAVPENMRGVDTSELFDLEADIGETTDVAAQHPEVVEGLMKLAAEVRESLGDYYRVGTDVRFFESDPKRPHSLYPVHPDSKILQ